SPCELERPTCAPRSADRRELEVQALEAPHQVDRRVLVAARAGRTVLRLRDPDIRHAIEEALHADATLGPRERRAGARVDAEPEPDVLASVRSVEAELVRGVELAWVSVRGARHDENARPRRDVDSAHARGDA